MIVADNGGPFYISGAPDARWNDDELHAISAIQGSDFEVVNTSGAVAPPRVSTPRVLLGSAVHLRVNGKLSRRARFTDAYGGGWSATVNYGDGHGTKRLTLSSNKRFSLAHRYTKRGTFHVTVKVRNAFGRTGTAKLKVIVKRR
jgi:hypothetical protein